MSNNKNFYVKGLENDKKKQFLDFRLQDWRTTVQGV